MSLNAFRAGSGSYQQIIPLQLAVSAIPPNSISVETYSAAGSNIAQGSITGLTNDSIAVCQPDAQSGYTAANGLVLLNSEIISTGVIQLTWENVTGSTISPGNLQVDLLVL